MKLVGICAGPEGKRGLGLEFGALESEGPESAVVAPVGPTVANVGEMGCWGAPHSSGSLARLLVFLPFTLPPPPLSLISHSQFSSSSSSSSTTCPPLSSIPCLSDWPMLFSWLSKKSWTSSWPFLFFFFRLCCCLPASPPGPTLSGLRGSELEEVGLLSSIEPLGERMGAAEGGRVL